MKKEIIITGDIHLGDGYLYGKFDSEKGMNSSLVDSINSLNQIAQYCEDNKVPYCVFTGDMFKEGNGSADSERRRILSSVLNRISKSVKRLFVVVGNHDIYGDTNIYADIDVWSGDNVEIIDTPRYIEEINAVALPYFNMKKVYDNDKSKEFNNLRISEIMNSIVDGLYDSIPDDKKSTAICLFHFTLSESEYKEGVLARWGQDIILSAESLALKFRQSFGGHLHEPQTIKGNCHYHGSITHSQPNQLPRSFISYDLESDQMNRIPLKHRIIHSIETEDLYEAQKFSMQDNCEKDSIVIKLLKPKSEYDPSEIRELENSLGKYVRAFIKYAPSDKKQFEQEDESEAFEGKTDIEIFEEIISKKSDNCDRVMKTAKEEEIFND